MAMKVYEALHNPMTEESAPYTISIHFSMEGAQKAIETSKEEVKLEHFQMRQSCLDSGDSYTAERLYSDDKWDQFHFWHINETEVLP